MNKTAISTAIALAMGLSGMVAVAHAATLNTGDTLTISPATIGTIGANGTQGVTGGSFFGMDLNKDSKISPTEKTGLAMGTNGLVIGVTTAPGSHHTGAPVAGDTGTIDAPWYFNGSTGTDWLSVAAGGSTTNGINLSGWTVAWSTLSAIPMGTGAWQPLNCSNIGCTGETFANGVANFTWDGVYGDSYTLNYTATVPLGDPSNFGGTQYFLHLVGTVNKAPATVPLPAAVWLLGSGLIGLVGVGRRKRSNQA